MTFPLDPSRLPVPLPARIALPGRSLPAVTRLAPGVQATLVAAVAGLGVELALRSVATRALGAVTRGTSAAPSAVMGTTRTVVTEFVIRERVRHFR